MKIPKLLVGAPGIGKTEITESKYDHTEKLLTSSMVEEDIAGLIYREGEDEKRTVPAFIKRIQQAVSQGKKTCLFLDEVDKGRREVVDTLLTLITHQEQYGVPKEVDIVMACNPPEWGGGDGVSIPMLNRVAVINFVPDVSGWCDWINKKFKHEFVEAITKRIVSGEIPILETTGEGFERRTTSPRSLTMAIGSYLSMNINEAKEIADGLLTPNVSSSVYLSFLNTSGEILDHDDKNDFWINKKSTKVVSRIFRK